MDNAPWNFDFALLDDPNFKEDSVREELIAPLLKQLGYSASPPNQIIRSKSLKHPFVYFGTKSHAVSIIPDYLLTREGKNFLVLDAKGPDEEIHTGENVAQAYSYAIHREVRADLFALCNGRDFVLFHVGRIPEFFSFPLKELESNWNALVQLIGTESEGIKVTFKADFGLHCLRLGFAFDKDKKKFQHIFVGVAIFMVALLNETTYTLHSYISMDDVVFFATFDFPKEFFDSFIKHIEPNAVALEIRSALEAQPFKWIYLDLKQVEPFIGMHAEIGDAVITNENESYAPFMVKTFI